MFHRRRRWAIVSGLVLLVVTGCTRSPEAQKARHLARGDRDAARAQYRDAILEYRNVLRYDAVNERALRQLGMLHYQFGELAQAFRYLLKAEEVAPDALDVRLKLGMIYILARKADDARREVAFVLSKEPNNLDGLALLASMAATSEGIDAAVQRLEAARALVGDRAKLHMALGVLHLRKEDLAAAERSFTEAVACEPTLAEPHLALGQLYLVKQDVVRAEREFRAAADIAPVGSPARLRLADFYLLAGKPDEAKRTLLEITRMAPAYLPAWRRVAEMAFEERNYDQSLKAVQVLLKKNPNDFDGHLLRGRVLLANRDIPEAIQEFQQVLKLDPRHALARYELGRAQLATGNLQQARAELKEAISDTPSFTEAVLLLAELNIQTGAVQPAIEGLQALIAQRPDVVEAHRLLGLAYLAKREPARATAEFRKVHELDPKNPRGLYLVGLGLRAQGNKADARREFEAALALDPGYVEPLAQLAAMALAEKQPDAALGRVTKQAGLMPTAGGIQYLLGMVHIARHEERLAERAFLKAAELEPALAETYVRLADLYQASGRYDEAIAKADQAVRVSPRALPPRMILGLVHTRKGEFKKAQETYEQVLTINPRFALAANNLAWLYSEHGGDKAKALQLAQVAKEAAPEDPNVSDTLGWILYKSGVYQQAVGLFRESARQLPHQPVVQYHLGLAAMKVGDKDSARVALTAAVNSPVEFVGKDEARKVLAELEQ